LQDHTERSRDSTECTRNVDCRELVGQMGIRQACPSLDNARGKARGANDLGVALRGGSEAIARTRRFAGGRHRVLALVLGDERQRHENQRTGTG